eukprot:2997544-Prymnesium_polylepis.1
MAGMRVAVMPASLRGEQCSCVDGREARHDSGHAAIGRRAARLRPPLSGHSAQTARTSHPLGVCVKNLFKCKFQRDANEL